MFEILVKGDKEMLSTIAFAKGFTCPRCGCAFRTDQYICRENTAANRYDDIVVCPWCGDEIEEARNDEC